MFEGSMVALVTPMHADGAIAWKAINELVEFHIASGTSAIVSMGTTGESPTLDVHEHLEVVRATVKAAKGRIPVIAGTGANSTSEAVELTRAAEKIGCQGVLLVAPYYNKPTQEGLFQHFSRIAEATALPVILYNIPGRTCCDILPATIKRIRDANPNVIGVKEATGANTLARTRELLEVCGKDFEVYSGEDNMARDVILNGGKGVISVSANVAPKLMADMCKAALAKSADQAAALDKKLAPLNEKLFVETNPIPVKWALHRMGKIPNGIRLPMTWLSKEAEAQVEAALRESGVL
jgi:4-hydroxy-tetrahydrodipicolinate synthase